MGKRKVLSESELKDLVLPEKGELLGVVEKLLGSDHALIRCTDDKVRLGRIRGKLKRRIWIREGDVVLVTPWEFDDGKSDIVWRYTVAQVDWLKQNNYLATGFA
ncbi:MAG: translation initiation factor eIF-1A [Nitrososphaeria archaeon]